MVSGGPGSRTRARHYSRGVLRPSSLSRALAGWLRRRSPRWAWSSAAPSGPTATPRAPGRPDPTQPLMLRMQLDHARLHPRPGPDRHPRHGHQRLRRGVDGDQRRGLRRLRRRSRRPPSSRRPPRHRSPPTSATGSPTPARSTPRLRSLPGRDGDFTVKLPRSKITVSAPGVYWFGVHALGATAAGRSDSAAGRDRTFLPLVPTRRRQRPGRADLPRPPGPCGRHPRPRRHRSRTSTSG